jgi:hypothetical protein
MKEIIKLNADYGSHPLWWDSPGKVGNIEPTALPLSQKILTRLLAWITIYESTLNWNDPASSGFPSEEAREAFEQEGISIWHQLRQELSPDYEVRYFSQKLRKVISHPRDLMATVSSP